MNIGVGKILLQQSQPSVLPVAFFSYRKTPLKIGSRKEVKKRISIQMKKMSAS